MILINLNKCHTLFFGGNNLFCFIFISGCLIMFNKTDSEMSFNSSKVGLYSISLLSIKLLAHFLSNISLLLFVISKQ